MIVFIQSVVFVLTYQSYHDYEGYPGLLSIITRASSTLNWQVELKVCTYD